MPKDDYYVYVVPLRRVYWGRRSNRADRAVRLLRAFIKRHLKIENVVITSEVNNYIWSRGREKPPRKIKVLVSVKERKKDEEEEKTKIAIVRLAGHKIKPGPYKPKPKNKKEKKSKS